MHKLAIAAAVVALSVVLGGTVLKDQVAWAATIMDVHITNLDAGDNVKVHEQGTANVTGTVTANIPGNVNTTVSSGNINARVSGRVESLPLPPQRPFNTWTWYQGNERTLVGPSALGINLTSIVASNLNASDSSVVAIFAVWVPDASTTCASSAWLDGGDLLTEFALLPAEPVVSTSFPTPIVVRPREGTRVCLVTRNSSVKYAGIGLTLTGFYG